MEALRAEVFQQAALRHARFYLQQLQLAHQYYHGQQMPLALMVFDEHWSQIYAAFDSLAQRSDDLEALRLCSDYVHFGMDFLTTRRTLPEQITWLTCGLEAARRLGKQTNELEYLNQLGRVYLVSKSLDLSVQYHEQALKLARDIGNQQQEANALVGLGRVAGLFTGYFDAAREYLHTASVMLRTLDDARGLGWCLQSLGALEERTGRYDEAEAYLDEAITIYEALGDQRMTASALRRLGSVAERRGDYALSLTYLHQALTIGQALDDIEVITNCLLTMGLIKDLQGESAAARTMFEEALSYGYKSGNKQNIGAALINLGWSATNLRDFEAALIYHRQSADLYRGLNHVMRTAAALNNLGFTQIQLGLFEDSISTLLDALIALSDIGQMQDYLDVVIGFAWLDLRQGDSLACARVIGMVLATPPEHMYPEREAYLKMVLPELEAALDPAALQAAYNEGRDLKPEAVRDALLQRYSIQQA